MKDLFAPAQRGALAPLATPDSLLVFDFDGTLAPIVAEPEQARLPDTTRARLVSLAAHMPCAVLSGRALDDLAPRVAGIPFVRLVGNHGLEPYGDLAEYERLARGWAVALAKQLGHVPGVRIENKRYTLSVHYRHADDPYEVEAAVRAAVATLGQTARLVPGKCVANVVPEGAPDKGVALEALRREHDFPPTLFVGDDETDEHAFARTGRGQGVSIGVRVGPREGSAAAYFVAHQGDMDALLDRLLALRG